MRTGLAWIGIVTLTGWTAVAATPGPDGFGVEVLVDDRPAPEFAARGTRYVEALEGREYTVRLRNPLPVRVAVALSVDGLNTIDARHTTAREARKWVLQPYETITIRGWQTTDARARRFYFTSEGRSYAHWMGATDNMGVITAVFFRERQVRILPLTVPESGSTQERPQAAARGGDGAGRSRDERASGAPPAAAASAADDEHAATGIGRPVNHPVHRVHLDLEEAPAASIALRYEYRAQLVKLGVLPPDTAGNAITRREKARGFAAGGYCPEPPKR